MKQTQQVLNKTHTILTPLSKLSIWAIILIASFSIVFEADWKFWKAGKNTPFTWDVNSYYCYLPAILLHQDFKFEKNEEYILTTAPNGQKLPKYTFGMAIMYSPFFLLGHKIAINQKSPLTGFSEPYATAIHYGSIFYTLLGLFFLRKVLLQFFSESVTALTLLCIFFTTNLFHYTLNEGEMSHAYLFTLISISLYYMIRWHESPKVKYSVLLGVLFGLITLIRPNQIIFTFVFFFYEVLSFADLKQKISFLILRKWSLLLMASISFTLVALQLVYWKYLTGSYFYFSYGKEGFFFSDPKIVEILFSVRKGWFIYTPIMFFALFGFFFLKNKEKTFSLGIAIYLLLTIYITASWWCWWYGGSFGMRPLVDSYPLMAILLAALFRKIFTSWHALNFKSIVLKFASTSLIIFFTWLNIIQTYQYKEYILHFDGMNKKTYNLIFGKLKLTEMERGELYSNLDKINYDEAQLGKER